MGKAVANPSLSAQNLRTYTHKHNYIYFYIYLYMLKNVSSYQYLQFQSNTSVHSTFLVIFLLTVTNLISILLNIFACLINSSVYNHHALPTLPSFCSSFHSPVWAPCFSMWTPSSLCLGSGSPHWHPQPAHACPAQVLNTVTGSSPWKDALPSHSGSDSLRQFPACVDSLLIPRGLG